MKNVLMFGAFAACAMTLSAAPAVLYSCNTVGVERVTSAASKKVNIPVLFNKVGGSSATLSSLAYLDNRALADTFQMMYNSVPGYYLQWMSVCLPGLSSYLYQATNDIGETAPSSDDQVVPRGCGVSVNRQELDKPMWSLGEYTPAPNTITFKRNTTTLLANNSLEPLDLDQVFTGQGISAADHIIIDRPEDGVSLSYSYIYNGQNDDASGVLKHWYRTEISYYDDEGNFSENSTNVFDRPMIPAGGAFRFHHGSRPDFTFSW